MRALRSFRTSQHTRMVRDLNPLHETSCVLANADHHSWTEVASSQFVGCNDDFVSHADKSVQMCLVNLHSVKRCLPVSRTLWHSGHNGLGLAANLSRTACLQSKFYFGQQANRRICTLKMPRLTRWSRWDWCWLPLRTKHGMLNLLSTIQTCLVSNECLARALARVIYLLVSVWQYKFI